jgi:hypothetical protein
MMKKKRVDLQTCGKMIGRCLLQFLHKSETEMVVMTEGIRIVGMTVMMWSVLIFLIPVMQ